jgi:SAM-dependent methyltransferase
MPIGCLSCVAPVAAGLMALRPRSVLDLGIGMGFYRGVVRQWLDKGVRPWTTELVGVEAWAAYRNPMWELYDELHIETIEAYLQRADKQFSAILLMDVLEHFEKPQGETVIEQCRARRAPGGAFWIATPAVWMEQGAAHGNEFERHQSLWTAADLLGRGFKIKTRGDPDQFGNQIVLAVLMD